MNTTTLGGQPVAKSKPKSSGKPKYLPAKLGPEAVRLGKIAASFKDMTLADYVTQVVESAARRDIDAEHAKMKRAEAPER